MEKQATGIRTPEDAVREATSEAWSAERWIATVIALIVGVGVIAFLQILAQ